MSVHINGRVVEVADRITVDALLRSLELPHHDVAVAVDGSVVPRSQWPTTKVQPDAHIEVVTAMQGG